MNIAPSTHATAHHGKFRAPRVVTLDVFYNECEPTEARGFFYDLAGSDPKNQRMIHLRPFHHTSRPPLDQSLTKLCYRTPKANILLVDARWPHHVGAREMDGFFNHILPPSEVRNCDGFVGIGVLRWVKTLFMLLLTAENEQTHIYREAFFRGMSFLHRLVQLDKTTYDDKWFGPVCAAIDGRKMEDVLIESLAEGVLGHIKTSARSFRSFELALRRTLSRNPELKHNMLMPLVMLFKTYLIRDDMPDNDALDRAFRVMDLPSFANLGMVRILLSEMFPELVPHAAAILDAATRSTKIDEISFYPPDNDIVFADGSMLKIQQPLPLGLHVLGGEITEGDTIFELTVDHMNNYTPLQFEIPTGGKVVITFSGQPMKDTAVNKFGPGVLARAFTYRPTKSDAFRGMMGPTLLGGIGNGISKPSHLRSRPSYLDGTENPILLGTLSMDRREIQLSSPLWDSPLCFNHNGGQYGALYFKGIKNITFQIEHQPPAIVTPISIPTSTHGFRMSEIIGSRFQSIQERAIASSF